MKTISDPEHLFKDFSETVVFKCIAGSRAYGTNRPDSDEDIRGVFVLMQSHYLSLKRPIDLVSDEKGDVVFYTLRRFLELASTANPNIIELLFMPDECVLTKTSLMDTLLNQRELFITKGAYESHIGYAQAQIKKARGRNK